MNLQLFRIDDRLIHGQVVLGWANHLDSERIILCDDAVAENDWEKELYLSCVPSTLKARILSTREAVDVLMSDTGENGKTIVLVKSPAVLLDMTEMGYVPPTVNLGGMHFSDERKKYLSYVFLNDSEIDDLRILSQKGIDIYCQDVPTSRRIPVVDILNGQGKGKSKIQNPKSKI